MKFELEDPADKTRAEINLAKVKARDVAKTYELYINSNTVIMVTKENHNKEYADNYRKTLEASQGFKCGK